MFPAIVTSSGVDAFDACIGTVVLPRVRGERSAAVDAGTGEHAERLRLGGLPDKVLAWFGGKEPAYEVAMAADTALDAAGGRASASLGRYLDRGYPLFPTPTWLAGTADMVRVDGDVVSVADLKTGRGQSRGALPPPEEAGQLLSLAWLTSVLAAARRPGWRPRRVRLAWWYTSERPDDVEDSEIEADRLFVWADRFCARVAQARAFGALQLQRGPQCQGCAAFDACPAQGGAIRRVAELSGTPEPDGALSPEYLAAAWNDLVAAERITAAAREAIQTRVAAAGPVPVGPSHELRLVRSNPTRLDPAVAEQVLGERFAECATISISQESMRRGLGVADVSGVVAEIEKRGGVIRAASAPYLRVLRRGR